MDVAIGRNIPKMDGFFYVGDAIFMQVHSNFGLLSVGHTTNMPATMFLNETKSFYKSQIYHLIKKNTDRHIIIMIA